MGEPSVIVEGVENDEAQYLLNSTVHGADRVLSRTKAAGKWKKVWQCGNRDCEYEIPVAQANTTPGKGMCPDHPGARPRKIRLRKGGEVDWAATLERLREERIVLKGGAADEAPAAYKRLNDVLMYHNRTIAVTHTLFPIGVAMAGSDTFDPYKD
jgi:tRNA-splicing ligase RtcB